VPLDVRLPSLCQYHVTCAKTISKETKDTPKIDIRHDIIATQQVFLPPNAKGCLQYSINRVKGSLDGTGSKPSYKDEL